MKGRRTRLFYASLHTRPTIREGQILTDASMMLPCLWGNLERRVNAGRACERVRGTKKGRKFKIYYPPMEGSNGIRLTSTSIDRSDMAKTDARKQGNAIAISDSGKPSHPLLACFIRQQKQPRT